MRKITLFLSALFALVGISAQAQLATGKYYRIQDNKHTKYLTIESYDANSSGIQGTVPVLGKEEGNEDQVWQLEAVDETNNQYKFKSKSGYYLQCRTWNCDAVSSGGSTITIAEVSTGEYHLKNGDKFFKVQTVNGVEHPFCDAPADNADIVTWSFVEVPANEVFAAKVNVTYKFMIDGSEYTTVTVQQAVNSEVDVPDQAFLTVQDTEGTIGEADCTITVNCTVNLPFVATTDLANPVWQIVEMHRYNGIYRYWEYKSGEEVNVSVVDYSNNKVAVLADKNLWCFVGDFVSGFKIYNKAAMAENPSWTLNATSGNATMGVAANGNDVWYLAGSAAASGDNVVCFTHDKKDYMNQQSGKIAYWGQTDNGSTCYAWQPTEYVPSVELSVSDAGYATANCPVAVNIPDGVEAYTGKYVGNEVTLTKIDGTLIPGNTPVILKAAAGTYTFTIDHTNATAAIASDLVGTTAKTTVPEATTAYILAKGDDGVVKFFKLNATEREIAAYKAYLVVPSANEAPAYINFNFGQATAIEGVEAESAAAPVYDLSGRKVTVPAKGIFIKNGKKIVVK